MAKLYFRYGAMGSSKTANALMVAYNYKERGKKSTAGEASDRHKRGWRDTQPDWIRAAVYQRGGAGPDERYST